MTIAYIGKNGLLYHPECEAVGVSRTYPVAQQFVLPSARCADCHQPIKGGQMRA